MRVLPITLCVGLAAVAGFTWINGGVNLASLGIPAGPEKAAPEAVRLTGVVAANEVVVNSKVPGRLLELKVEEGSIVKAGDLIAVLDSEELEAERKDMQARINQLLSKQRQARETVVLEQERHRSQTDRAGAQTQVADSQYRQAVAELEQTKTDVARIQKLVGEGIAPRQELDRQLTNLKIAEARLRSLDDQVKASRADQDLVRANRRQVSLAQQEVEQIGSMITQTRAQLSQVETRLGYVQVYAPLGGMVSLRVAARGEVVRAGDPIVTIVDLDDIWVRVDVEESLVTRLAVGQAVGVQLASGEGLDGKVIAILPDAEFATQRDVSRTKRDIRTFGMKVRVPNPERRVHPGMTAYVALPEKAAALSRGISPGAPTSQSPGAGQDARAVAERAGAPAR